MSGAVWLGDGSADDWIPNSNKINVGPDQQYARELFQRPQAREQFFNQMGQLMLMGMGAFTLPSLASASVA